MTTKDQGSRGAAVTNADQIGKMFIVVRQERQCLILDGMFTRRSAAEHVELVCDPRFPNDRLFDFSFVS